MKFSAAVHREHFPVPQKRSLHADVPGNVDLVHGVLPELLHTRAVVRVTGKDLRDGQRVFLREEPALPVLYPLRRTAPADQNACQSARRSFPDDDAVGVEGRREEKEIRPGEVGAQEIPVADGSREDQAVRKANLFPVPDHLVLFGSVADKDHPEVVSLFPDAFQGVQDQPHALVPHHASDKEINGHACRQIMESVDLCCLFRRNASPGKVHAVFHHRILALVAHASEVLSRPSAYDPHVVGSRDVFDEEHARGVAHHVAFDVFGKLDIECSVIGQDHRRTGDLAQHPRQDRRDDRAVGMDHVRHELFDPPEHLLVEGIPGPVSDELRGVQAFVPEDLKGVFIPDSGIVRRRHQDVHPQFGQDLRVVQDDVRDPVDHRREGIVEQDDAELVFDLHGKTLFPGSGAVSRPDLFFGFRRVSHYTPHFPMRQGKAGGQSLPLRIRSLCFISSLPDLPEGSGSPGSAAGPPASEPSSFCSFRG